MSHVGRYFYTLLLFIARCVAAQFRRVEILSWMGLSHVSIPAPSSVHQCVHKESSIFWFLGVCWCKWVTSLIYYIVLSFIEENPKLKQSLQSYSSVIEVLSGATSRVCGKCGATTDGRSCWQRCGLRNVR